MNTVAFIQARMGSTRLPGKTMMDLVGKPVLARVVERVRACPLVDEVVVVTTLNANDLPIVAWCAASNVRVFCGSENDVLDRFYQAAKIIKPKTMLRITADCPLMDPDTITTVIKKYNSESFDYVNNVEHETWPDGQDVEVFSFNSLEKAWNNAKLDSEREHVTIYIRKHPDIFKIAIVDHTPSLGSFRWTLDQQEDFAFITEIYKSMGDHIFGMNEVLDLLAKKPEMNAVNGGIIRNEGYIKSLAKEKAAQGRE